MSMPSQNFDDLVADFPSERESIQRLSNVLSAQKAFMTVEQLVDRARPNSYGAFLQILSELVRQGVLKRRVRVYSPGEHFVGEFESLVKIPTELEDERTGQLFQVGMENLRQVFRPR
jgi:hypothetical protein